MSEELIDNRGRFPGSVVGDRLFHYDVEDGLHEMIIIGVDDVNGKCLCVSVHEEIDMYDPPVPFIAYSSLRKSPEDAIRHCCEFDISYHGKKAEQAEMILKAIDSGENIERYYGGLGYEDD